MINIEELIPQRHPFKFVDEVLDHTSDKITVKAKMQESFEFYQGHFPGNPITPGVILCEAVFQSGALLMALRGKENGGEGLQNKTTVVTRINNAKFKNLSRPGDEILIDVQLQEEIANAVFMKAKAQVEGKTILTIEFAAAAVEAHN